MVGPFLVLKLQSVDVENQFIYPVESSGPGLWWKIAFLKGFSIVLNAVGDSPCF